MYQAVTQVNVSSPEIFIVVEADGFHSCGKQYHCSRYRLDGNDSTGVLVNGMIQDGIYVNLGDPLNSFSLNPGEYSVTSWKRQGTENGLKEVGLTNSTLRAGKPFTWGSGQRCYISFSSCLSNTRRLI